MVLAEWSVSNLKLLGNVSLTVAKLRSFFCEAAVKVLHLPDLHFFVFSAEPWAQSWHHASQHCLVVHADA